MAKDFPTKKKERKEERPYKNNPLDHTPLENKVKQNLAWRGEKKGSNRGTKTPQNPKEKP